MINRWIEDDLLEVLESHGVGCIAFSALAQGVLSDHTWTASPRFARREGRLVLPRAMLNEDNLARVRALHDIARRRGQHLAQMAIAWVLRTRASPPPPSARAVSTSWSRMSPHSIISSSRPTSWPRSTATPSKVASTCGVSRLRAESAPRPSVREPARAWSCRRAEPGRRRSGLARPRGGLGGLPCAPAARLWAGHFGCLGHCLTVTARRVGSTRSGRADSGAYRL